MNRTRQLKLLNEEIRRLFSQDISEKDAFDQLSSDPRFDTVRRNSVQSLYKKMQKDAEKQEKKKELTNQKRYQQNAKKLLFYNGQLIKNAGTSFDGIWKGRYFLISKSSNERMATFELVDLYQNVSKELSLLPDNRFYSIRALDGQFAMITQVFDDVLFVHLTRIDLVDGSLDLVQTAENGLRIHSTASIIPDLSDYSKFAIGLMSGQGTYSIFEYNLSGGKLSISNEVTLENFDFSKVAFYSDNQLAGLKFDDGHLGDINHASVFIQELHGEKKLKFLKLGPLPSNVHRQSPTYHRWCHDHLFLSIEFRLTWLHGIAFTKPETQKWTILEFAMESPVVHLEFIDNRSLFICGGKYGLDYENYEINEIYKLPVNKPELLRYKAWFTVVESFKKKQVDNPYEQARKFLPLNSEIHSLLNVADREPDNGQGDSQ